MTSILVFPKNEILEGSRNIQSCDADYTAAFLLEDNHTACVAILYPLENKVISGLSLIQISLCRRPVMEINFFTHYSLLVSFSYSTLFFTQTKIPNSDVNYWSASRN